MTTAVTSDHPSASLHVELDAAAELSLAMVENSVPLVSRLSLSSTSDAPLRDLVVEAALLPDFSAKWTTHVSAIPPGATFNLDAIELPLDRGKLVNQLERGAADLMVWVRHPSEPAPIATTSRRIDVLAYNEWSRATVPELLAAFVLPNHPVIAQLLGDARGPLEALTGSPALDGYQSGDPHRITAIADAIYQTVQRRGITYSNPPASFETAGQKIRTPEQIATEQVGTCLDISVLFAAALEQAGLHPLVVLIEGHAFPGVWLEDYFVPEALIDDGATLRKLVQLGRVLVFDSSIAVARPPHPLADAQRRANQALETTPFRHAVDITGCRKLHFRPLPIRVAGGYAAAVEVPVVAPGSSPTAVPRPTRSDTSGSSRSGKTRHPRIEAWKQKLLDTSLRNRLLNFKDTNQSLDVLTAEIGPIEDAIASGEELVIQGRPAILGGDDPRSKKLLDARVADDAWKPILRDRLQHGELYADHAADVTDRKLTTIFRAARTALEETGTNTLCLAFGMLHWYESDTSEQPRRAPILLVPVALERNARSGRFTLRSSNEDTRLNVTLFEKLRQDTGITIGELDELPLDEAGVDVPAVLGAVRSAIINLRRWEVKEEVHLGLFSFAKFQMWADLEQNVDALLKNPVVDHLLNGKGEPYPNDGPFPDPAELDARFSPKDLLCPLDADASQLAAVAAATEGKTFVLQGPPGTGKSQTITNLITHCISHGKRVLFVAEKAAALDVVQRRLAHVGLAPYVLELHSHKAGKQEVLDQFREALEALPAGEPASWQSDTTRLGEDRAQLNAYARALHASREVGFTAFQLFGRLSALRDAPRLELPASCAASRQQLEELGRHVDELRDALTALGTPSRSAWDGCRIPAWQVDLPSRVASAIERAQRALTETQEAGARLAFGLGASTPVGLADIDSLVEVATTLAQAPAHGDALLQPGDWQRVEQEARGLVALVRKRSETMTALRARYDAKLFSLDLDALAARFRRLANAFFLVAWWGLRAAKKTLRQVALGGLADRHQVASDLENAQAARALELQLEGQGARGQALYGPSWRASESDPAALEAAVGWAARLRELFARARPGLLAGNVHAQPELAQQASAARAAAGALRTALADLWQLVGWTPPAVAAGADEWQLHRERLGRWQAQLDQLRNWCAYLSASTELARAGCTRLVEAAATAALGPDQLRPTFERGVYEAWVGQILAADPALRSFDGEHQRKRIAEFRDLDRAYLGAAGGVARATISRQAPHAGATGTAGEMGVLQTVLKQKRPRKSIRRLLAEIPAVAGRLKPCFLMSPMSVATYLEPGTSSFDLVVFDEASQIPTHDAVGVLARARAAVVVGDSKQLPPTSFFQSGEGDDDSGTEPEFEELESILDQCIASGIPERRLDWHYRSRHETLIAFSNYHYYRNRLHTFPSAAPAGPGLGVHLREIDGYYDKGGAATNQAEAEAIVADLMARLRAPDAKERSYGIVTFSQAQQKLVEDLLDEARRGDTALDPFFDRKTNPEYVIVKNLENIQGDERDVIIFSICYGPDQTGRVSMNFGPLNRDGGERRLNVAITRARQELVVYATLRPEHIDLSRTKAVGVKHLKTFLDYARRGPAAIAEALAVQTADQFDSPFEHQVCERLRALGYTVHTQVGCAGYRIDMALCHPDEPGRYVLAIECDGAHYHSARSARERDRLRAQVLAGLGWHIHRIWSTDWWQAPDRELAKVQAAYEEAKRSLASRPVVAPAAAPSPSRFAVPVRPAPAAAVVAPRPVSTPAPAPATRDAGAELYARAAPHVPSVVPYEIARVPEGRRTAEDIYDQRFQNELRELLQEIVRIEAPISLRVLARRVAPYFAISRMSSRLDTRLRQILGRSVKIQDDIVWRSDQDPMRYTGARLAPTEAHREASDIPLEEVANAALTVLHGAIALDQDELVKLTARALGFARTGDRVASHMAAGVSLLVRGGRARSDGGKIVIA